MQRRSRRGGRPRPAADRGSRRAARCRRWSEVELRASGHCRPQVRGTAERVACPAVIILDGGTGTLIQVLGAPMDDETWGADANLTHPDIVREAHRQYLSAGAEVLIA